MINEPKYSEDNIRSLSRSEWFQIRLFDVAQIDPLYVIMGGVQEYFGGYSLDEEMVDHYFVNEWEQAQVFQKICEHYLKSLNLESDVELIKVESGHSYLQSKQICEKLKEQFTSRDPDFLNHKCFRLSSDNDLYKTAEELYGDRSKMFNFRRYSYLLGVILKNKLEDKPAINFANASHKTDLTIEIIREFSAFGDRKFNVEYFFGVPQVTRITLSEENAIWATLDDYKKKVESPPNIG